MLLSLKNIYMNLQIIKPEWVMKVHYGEITNILKSYIVHSFHKYYIATCVSRCSRRQCEQDRQGIWPWSSLVDQENVSQRDDLGWG